MIPLIVEKLRAGEPLESTVLSGTIVIPDEQRVLVTIRGVLK